MITHTLQVPRSARPSDHEPARDAFGRRISYLRVSLTDRCNLRCLYCMPAGGVPSIPSASLLTNAEILRILAAAAAVGFEKIRFTGGEPTLRAGLLDLVRASAGLPGMAEIALTTNGLHLRHMAQELADAGLTRVNVSLDTLDPARFKLLTRGGDLRHVWAGLLAAEQAGLTPLKLNCVLVAGINDQDLAELAGLTIDRPWHVRFIELMPFAGVEHLAATHLRSTAAAKRWIEEACGPLEALEHGGPDPAQTYRLAQARGTLGFIGAQTIPFCATCNRLRLTADGKLHLCLLRDTEVDIGALVRAGAPDDELQDCIRQAVWAKPWGHGLADGIHPTQRSMHALGG